MRGPGNNDLFFRGEMDDFALWNRALSAEEIETIYQFGLMGQNITFAPIIPEPSTLLLLGGGMLGLCLRRNRKRATA